MQDNTLLLVLAMGGLALVCLMLMGGLLLLVLRLARGPIFSFFGLLARGVDDNDDEDSARATSRRPTPDLRAIAAQSDFDTALATKQMQAAAAPPTPGSVTGASGTSAGRIIQGARAQSALGTDAHPRIDLGTVPDSPLLHRRDRKTGRGRADQEDEMFGGMLDFDGDGRSDV
ncbi:MAG: hypothetical protein SGJ24_18060 [Chloroflexota bacterium]|nr:hypothetical protein [Chloroflexota bacterium]